MATLVAFCGRTDWVQVVEEFFNHPDPAVLGDRYRWALGRLEGDELLTLDFLDTGEELSDLETRIVEGEAVGHFRSHWLATDGSGFWPDLDGEAVAIAVGQGFRAAIEEALELELPLTVVQVTAGDKVQVGHVPGPTSVTVVIATPEAHTETE